MTASVQSISFDY